MAQLIYGIHGNVPPVHIGADTYSMLVRHVIAVGVDQRTLTVEVTPSSGQSQQLIILIADAETITAGISQALTLQANNGSTITQGGQTLVMNLESITMPIQAGGFTMNNNPNGLWYIGYQHAGGAQFSRMYPTVNLQQFADYINLGVAFANALP